MKKLLIIITCFASLPLVACVSRWHIVHRIDIQQGNVVTQDMVDQLKIGMNRSQVQFIMGTPLIVDTFHQQRWDYLYYFKPGYGKATEQQVTLYFDDDSLARITGAVHPEAGVIVSGEKNTQLTVVVPPYERVEPGILNKLWHWITFRQPGEN